MQTAEREMWRLFIMKALIKNIKVKERVRKEVTRIDELAADIRAHGLLNPITVIAVSDDEYRLIAGLRRLKAIESIGFTEVDVNVVSPANAEIELMMEISENEQREQFTFSEKAYYGKLLDEIEQAKANERLKTGQSNGGKTAGNGRSKKSCSMDCGPQSKNKTTRDVVGEKIGVSGRQYDRIKFIDENAPDEIKEELDKGKRSIRGTYDELRSKENAEKTSAAIVDSDVPKNPEPESSKELPNTTVETETTDLDIECNAEESKSNEKSVKTVKSTETAKITDTPKTPVTPKMTGLLSKEDEAAIQRNKEFNAMPPLEKVKELQRQLKEERARATHAESELANLKEFHRNTVYHKDGIITNLTERLEEAETRVKELEDLYGIGERA